MLPLYPYQVTQTTSVPFTFDEVNPPENEIIEDATRVFEAVSGAISLKQLAVVCAFARLVQAQGALYIGKKHNAHGIDQSVIVIPTQAGSIERRVFVSLGKKIVAQSGQGFDIKEIAMLSFDQTGRLREGKEGVCKIVKLVTGFTEQRERIECVRSRISCMQKMDNHPSFPTNYGYVLTASNKVVTKLSIFQERAVCDLWEFERKKLIPVPTLSLETRTSLCKVVVSALQALHAEGIIYRDLKFENILVFETTLPTGEKTWQFKLTDLGLARRIDDVQLQNSIDGTLEWVAPELIKSRLYRKPLVQTPKNDLWALGLFIHFLFDVNMPRCMSILDVPEGKSPNWKEWFKALSQLPEYPARITQLQDLVPALMQTHPDERITLEQINAFLETPKNRSLSTLLSSICEIFSSLFI